LVHLLLELPRRREGEKFVNWCVEDVFIRCKYFGFILVYFEQVAFKLFEALSALLCGFFAMAFFIVEGP
jgi:hypothetical protein